MTLSAESRHDEFRLVWQREGFGKRTKIYQQRRAAERYIKVLRGEVTRFDGRDPSEYECCDGWNCGCRGATVADAIKEERERYADVPAFVIEPRIESRPVGTWSTTQQRVERLGHLRVDSESPTPAVRHEAVLALIAEDYYLAYSDARFAADLALSGAHARTEEDS